MKLDINKKLLGCIQNNVHNLFGINLTKNEDPTLQQFSVKSLQEINLLSLSLSKLQLKTSASVMLLRNIDQTYKLNNKS